MPSTTKYFLYVCILGDVYQDTRLYRVNENNPILTNVINSIVNLFFSFLQNAATDWRDFCNAIEDRRVTYHVIFWYNSNSDHSTYYVSKCAYASQYFSRVNAYPNGPGKLLDKTSLSELAISQVVTCFANLLLIANWSRTGPHSQQWLPKKRFEMV